MRHIARSVFSRARSWTGRPLLRCAFCGRNERQVPRLVAGAFAHICDSCITQCVTVLEQHGGFDRPSPTQTH